VAIGSPEPQGEGQRLVALRDAGSAILVDERRVLEKLARALDEQR
jgi:hypothetical protein